MGLASRRAKSYREGRTAKTGVEGRWARLAIGWAAGWLVGAACLTAAAETAPLPEPPGVLLSSTRAGTPVPVPRFRVRFIPVYEFGAPARYGHIRLSPSGRYLGRSVGIYDLMIKDRQTGQGHLIKGWTMQFRWKTDDSLVVQRLFAPIEMPGRMWTFPWFWHSVWSISRDGKKELQLTGTEKLPGVGFVVDWMPHDPQRVTVLHTGRHVRTMAASTVELAQGRLTPSVRGAASAFSDMFFDTSGAAVLALKVNEGEGSYE